MSKQEASPTAGQNGSSAPFNPPLQDGLLNSVSSASVQKPQPAALDSTSRELHFSRPASALPPTEPEATLRPAPQQAGMPAEAAGLKAELDRLEKENAELARRESEARAAEAEARVQVEQAQAAADKAAASTQLQQGAAAEQEAQLLRQIASLQTQVVPQSIFPATCRHTHEAS